MSDEPEWAPFPDDTFANVHQFPPAKGNGQHAEEKPAKSIWLETHAWVEEQVPPRPWLAVGYLLRASLTLLAGPGSAGKSMLMVAWAIALALGRQFANFRPTRPLRVLVYNVEDDANEQTRRFSATLRQFGASPQDIAGRVIRSGPNHAGTLIHFNPAENTYRHTEAMQDLEEAIVTYRPDVVFLDPLIELHNAPENDNTALRMIAAIFRDLAIRHDIAIAIADHARKGSADSPGDPDTIRGASSKVGAVRIALTVTTMSEKDAESLSINTENRRSYFRVDGAKQNYAPITEAEWFERQEYELDNGERIAAAIPWAPPLQVVSEATGIDIRAALKKGVGGQPYSPRLSQTEPRSIIHLFNRLGVTAHKTRKDQIATLYAEGWTLAEFWSRGNNKVKGLRSPDAQPTVRWTDESQE